MKFFVRLCASNGQNMDWRHPLFGLFVHLKEAYHPGQGGGGSGASPRNTRWDAGPLQVNKNTHTDIYIHIKDQFSVANPLVGK